MENKKTNFNLLKIMGALVFLMAFTLNIQTSLNGEWELVNVGFAQGSGGSGGSGGAGCDPPSAWKIKWESCKGVLQIRCRTSGDPCCYANWQDLCE